jgi:hypothetical protein
MRQGFSRPLARKTFDEWRGLVPWALYARVLRDLFHQLVVPVAIALIIAAIFTPAPVLAIGLVLVGVVAAKVALHVRDGARTEALAPVEPIRA